MKFPPSRLLMGAVSLGIFAVSGLQAQEARADALHVFCVSPTPTCVDNGSITPTASLSPDFGFLKSPNSGTGILYLEVLIPDNVVGAATENFTLAGTNTEIATISSSLFSTTPWTSGQLDSYLGISAQPTNPIGAFLPLTQLFQQTATGYYDYQFNFGSVTFGSGTDPLFTTTFDFPEGAIITAYSDAVSCSTKGGVTTCKDNWTATANSAALLIDSPIPEPSSAAALIAGLLGLGMAYRFRRS